MLWHSMSLHASERQSDLIVPAIIGEGLAVLHLPVREYLAQLLHQTGHTLPLLPSLDAALQLAVCIPTLLHKSKILLTIGC